MLVLNLFPVITEFIGLKEFSGFLEGSLSATIVLALEDLVFVIVSLDFIDLFRVLKLDEYFDLEILPYFILIIIKKFIKYL